MKKINTILAAFGALLMLSVTMTSANSVEFKAGVSANGMGAYANASETLKDSGRLTNKEAVIATSFASIFAEVSSDEIMGLGIGVSYAPEVVDLNKETRQIDTCNDQTGGNTGAACVAKTGSGADSGTTTVDAKINDLMEVYLTLPLGGEGAYAKVGYVRASMVTEESLATGSKYEDVDMSGMSVSGGYEGSLGDMAFWRAEGSYQMWEDIDISGSESGGGGGKNKLNAEIGSVVGTFSLGMKF